MGRVVTREAKRREFLRADTHRGWGIASTARAAARWARFLVEIPRHGPPHLRSQRDFGRVHRSHPWGSRTTSCTTIGLGSWIRAGAMLFGRNTYELMEGAWPRSGTRRKRAPRAMARVGTESSRRRRSTSVSGLADRLSVAEHDQGGRVTFARRFLGSEKRRPEAGWSSSERPKLATALEELGLIDEYRIVVHPIISGRGGRRLFHGLSSARAISSSYRRSGSSPACRRSTSVAKRDERGRTSVAPASSRLIRRCYPTPLHRAQRWEKSAC